MMKEDLNKIRPVLGEEYLLYENGNFSNSFKGIYLGRKKEKTPWYLQPKTPEGHLFLKLNWNQTIELCGVRTGNNVGNTLNFDWFSDGYDDPSWPAGICVNKLNIKLNNLEKEYLLTLIEKKLNTKKMVA